MSRQKTIVTLLPELITEILLWLPVKSLLQCRCVSKSFCSLIDSSYFIMEHVKRSVETRSRLKLIIQDFFIERPEWMPVSYHPTLILEVDLDNEVKVVEKLDNPVRPGAYLRGSCNGLLLLFSNDKMFVDDDSLALWNPYTRRCKELPVCPIEIPHELGFSQNSYFGLGYDSNSDDYKVLWISKIFEPNNVNLAIQVWIFGLRSNTWRRLPDFPHSGCGIISYGHFANGAVHWLLERDESLSSKPSKMIVAFDMSNEIFYRISLPFSATKGSHTILTILEECLCIGFHTYKNHEITWYVRKKHGDGFSWIELYNSTRRKPTCGYPIPLAYSKNGNKVLMDQNDMETIWYDLKEKTCETFEIPGLPFQYNAVVSLESLVSLGDDSKFDGNVLWGELRRDWEFDGPLPDDWEFDGGLDDLLGVDGVE